MRQRTRPDVALSLGMLEQSLQVLNENLVSSTNQWKSESCAVHLFLLRCLWDEGPTVVVGLHFNSLSALSDTALCVTPIRHLSNWGRKRVMSSRVKDAKRCHCPRPSYEEPRAQWETRHLRETITACHQQQQHCSLLMASWSLNDTWCCSRAYAELVERHGMGAKTSMRRACEVSRGLHYIQVCGYVSGIGEGCLESLKMSTSWGFHL